jgi:hypothetical protein
MIKTYKSILICAVIFLGSSYLAYAQEAPNAANAPQTKPAGIPQFILEYTSVDHTMKNDLGYAFELIGLFGKDQAGCLALTDAWQSKADAACSSVTGEEAKSCRKKFYSDNWDEINKTIIEKCRAIGIQVKERAGEGSTPNL